MNNAEIGFKMKFDNHTIKHLGIQLYSSFPPVIAELVSNAYDAEAENVEIIIDYNNKSVIIKDDGHGMNHEDLNKQFLVIGRNRRENKDGFSKNNKRKVTGKKGLGKLAVFGIADSIEVNSICNKYQNSFLMDYKDIEKSTDGEYSPKPICENKTTEENNGTTITIKNIKQKNITTIENLAYNLSKRFSFYDNTFKVIIKNNNDNTQKMNVTKNIYFEKLKEKAQFKWKFQEDFKNANFDGKKHLLRNKVTGEIITTQTPLTEKKDNGFIIYSRGKLASNNTFFQERVNDNFNSYVTGYFNIDYIDDDNNIDNIGTARQELLWANEGMEKLKTNLNNLIKVIASEWRDKRKQEKKKKVEKELGEDFYEGLSPSDKSSMEKIIETLLKNSTYEDNFNSLVEVANSVKVGFSFNSFQEYILSIEDEKLTVDNVKKIATDWEMIETKELAKVAKGRICAINKFEKYIHGNASESKTIQPFLEKFPWLLDPQITQFQREVTFSNLLKKQFPNEKLEEPNKRIDFLCNQINGKLMIIELKRPKIKITQKIIDQVLDYIDFTEKHSKEAKKNGLDVYLITDNYKLDPPRIEKTLAAFEKDGTFYVKTYTDLLNKARQYNNEFIKAYDNIASNKEEYNNLISKD